MKNDLLIFSLIFFSSFVKLRLTDSYCDLTDNKEAISAINRAKSEECKHEIKKVSCELKNGTLFNYTHLSARFCPKQERIRFGCVERSDREEFFENIKNNTFSYDETNLNNDLCLAICVTYNNQYYVYDEEGNSCKCLFKVKSNVISKYTRHQCLNGGLDIYSTGLPSLFFKFILILSLQSLVLKARVALNESYLKVDFELKLRNISNNSVRIVFLFTITGRSLRHVQRIFKMLYHKHHYYYFHIDSVCSSFIEFETIRFKYL